MQFLDPDKESFDMRSSFEKAADSTSMDFGVKDKDPFKFEIGEDKFENHNEKPTEDRPNLSGMNFGFGGKKPLKFGINDYVKILDHVEYDQRKKTILEYQGKIGKIVEIGSGWIKVNFPDGVKGFRSYELQKVDDYTGPEIGDSYESKTYKKKGIPEGAEVKVISTGEVGIVTEVTGNNRYIVEIEGDEYTYGRSEIENLEISSPSSDTDLHKFVKSIYNDMSDADGSTDHISPLELFNAASEEYEEEYGDRPNKQEMKDMCLAVICGSSKPASTKKKVYPRKKPCPSGQEISPKSGRCVKKCTDKQIRNPSSGRCVDRNGEIGRKILGRSPKLRKKKKKTPSPVLEFEEEEDEVLDETESPDFEFEEEESPPKKKSPMNLDLLFDSPKKKTPSPDLEFEEEDLIDETESPELEFEEEGSPELEFEEEEEKPKRKSISQRLKDAITSKRSKRRKRRSKRSPRTQYLVRTGINCKDDEYYSWNKKKCVKKGKSKKRTKQISLLDRDEPFDISSMFDRQFSKPKRKRFSNTKRKRRNGKAKRSRKLNRKFSR